MIGTTAALITAAAIGAGGSIASGVIGSRAAKGAAKTQSDAGERVGQQAIQTADEEAARVTSAGERSATDVTSAAERAAQGIRLSADEANGLLRSIYGNAMDSLEPYTATGTNAIRTLNAALGPEGDFNRNFTAADLELDPGYQFRLQEGQKALERSAALRGGALGGSALKSLGRYSQGMASQEYGNAFERFRQNRADRFGMLYNLANVGLRATETGIGAGETYGGRAAGNVMRSGEYAGNADMDAAARAGDFRLGSVGGAANLRMRGLDIWGNATTGAANATAAGQMGSANAWTSTLSQIGRTGMDLAYLNPTLRNPYDPKQLPVGVPKPSTVPGVPTFDPATGQFVYRP